MVMTGTYGEAPVLGGQLCAFKFDSHLSFTIFSFVSSFGCLIFWPLAKSTLTPNPSTSLAASAGF